MKKQLTITLERPEWTKILARSVLSKIDLNCQYNLELVKVTNNTEQVFIELAVEYKEDS